MLDAVVSTGGSELASEDTSRFWPQPAADPGRTRLLPARRRSLPASRRRRWCARCSRCRSHGDTTWHSWPTAQPCVLSTKVIRFRLSGIGTGPRSDQVVAAIGRASQPFGRLRAPSRGPRPRTGCHPSCRPRWPAPARLRRRQSCAAAPGCRRARPSRWSRPRIGSHPLRAGRCSNCSRWRPHRSSVPGLRRLARQPVSGSWYHSGARVGHGENLGPGSAAIGRAVNVAAAHAPALGLSRGSGRVRAASRPTGPRWRPHPSCARAVSPRRIQALDASSA